MMKKALPCMVGILGYVVGAGNVVALPAPADGTSRGEARACTSTDCSAASGVTFTVASPAPPQSPPPPPPPPTENVLFDGECTSGNQPGCNWPDPQPTDARWTRTFLPTGGPTGGGAMELRQVYCAECGDYGGQFNWGWRGNVEASDPPQGSRRYYRFRMYVDPATNHRGRDWDGGGVTGPQNKLLIIGQGCGSRCRVIFTTETTAGSSSIRNFRIQIDGGADLVDSGSYRAGQWLNIQIELHAANNGGYKVWINNQNFNRPTMQRTGIVLNSSNWRYVWLGAFMNDGLARDGVNVFRLADFQVSGSFNPNW